MNSLQILIFIDGSNKITAIEAIMIKKLKPKLNHQIGPDKGSRITLNIFK